MNQEKFKKLLGNNRKYLYLILAPVLVSTLVTLIANTNLTTAQSKIQSTPSTITTTTATNSQNILTSTTNSTNKSGQTNSKVQKSNWAKTYNASVNDYLNQPGGELTLKGTIIQVYNPQTTNDGTWLEINSDIVGFENYERGSHAYREYTISGDRLYVKAPYHLDYKIGDLVSITGTVVHPITNNLGTKGIDANSVNKITPDIKSEIHTNDLNTQKTSEPKNIPQKGYLDVTTDNLNVRAEPNTTSNIVAHYGRGDTIEYDSIETSNGYIWASYVADSSKIRRYIAIGLSDGSQMYGNLREVDSEWGKPAQNTQSSAPTTPPTSTVQPPKETDNTQATTANSGSQRIVYVATGGSSDAYWYSRDNMTWNTNMNNVVTMTESEAIARGKHHSLTER